MDTGDNLKVGKTRFNKFKGNFDSNLRGKDGEGLGGNILAVLTQGDVGDGKVDWVRALPCCFFPANGYRLLLFLVTVSGIKDLPEHPFPGLPVP